MRHFSLVTARKQPQSHVTMETVVCLVRRYGGAWRTDVFVAHAPAADPPVAVFVGPIELCSAAARLAPQLASTCRSGLDLVRKTLDRVTINAAIDGDRRVADCSYARLGYRDTAV